MKTFTHLTKISLFCILLVTGLYSCTQSKPKNDPHCGKWILGYTNDNNWTRQAIICDSLQMINEHEAYVYTKGAKTHVVADKLYPMFVPCK